MKPDNEIEPMEVYAGTQWQVEMLRSLLETAGIEAFLKEEITGTLYPWWAETGGVEGIKVFVASKDYEQAKLITDEYEKTLEEG